MIKGLNGTDNALKDIASTLEVTRPDQIHLMLPIRPPAESWVTPAGEDEKKDVGRAGISKARNK